MKREKVMPGAAAGRSVKQRLGRSGSKIVQMDLFQAEGKEGAPRGNASSGHVAPRGNGKQKTPKTPQPSRGASSEQTSDKTRTVLPAADTPIREVAEPIGKKTATPSRNRETAQTMARRQREISVAEFFQKNRHLLGFDNPAKALLTATKEAVDNSLDACEEAGILPKIEITVEQLSEERFRISITDNGPGIVRAQIPKIFGKLLYGSKFHVLRQSRGQQGIGISAAGMYSQLTTGRPLRITSRTGGKRPAHFFEIQIDTARNEPKVLTDRQVEWDRDHGTRVEMELAGTYKKGRRSVDDYVVQTALANPHAEVLYTPPKGDEFRRERLTSELPREPQAIKPHPHGVELGALISKFRDTRGRTLRGALQADYSRISEKVAEEICRTAGIDPESRPRSLKLPQIEALFQAIPKIKIMNPPASCIVPIGEELILEGLKKAVKGEFFTSTTRPPAVYRGNPFVVEAGLAFGGDLPAEELVDLWRFANRVPLQYQQSACAITKAVVGTNLIEIGWRLDPQQGKGALPTGPLVLFVHLASVWVPFTSESKEAIAAYPEILRELRLGLQECGRRLGSFLRHRRRMEDAEKKKSFIRAYIPHIGIALKEILDLSDKEESRVVEVLTDTLERTRKI